MGDTWWSTTTFDGDNSCAPAGSGNPGEDVEVGLCGNTSNNANSSWVDFGSSSVFSTTNSFFNNAFYGTSSSASPAADQALHQQNNNNNNTTNTSSPARSSRSSPRRVSRHSSNNHNNNNNQSNSPRTNNVFGGVIRHSRSNLSNKEILQDLNDDLTVQQQKQFLKNAANNNLLDDAMSGGSMTASSASDDDADMNSDEFHDEQVNKNEPNKKAAGLAWYKKRWVMFLGVFLLVAIIASVAGFGIGMSVGGPNSSSESELNNNSNNDNNPGGGQEGQDEGSNTVQHTPGDGNSEGEGASDSENNNNNNNNSNGSTDVGQQTESSSPPPPPTDGGNDVPTPTLPTPTEVSPPPPTEAAPTPTAPPPTEPYPTLPPPTESYPTLPPPTEPYPTLPPPTEPYPTLPPPTESYPTLPPPTPTAPPPTVAPAPAPTQNFALVPIDNNSNNNNNDNEMPPPIDNSDIPVVPTPDTSQCINVEDQIDPNIGYMMDPLDCNSDIESQPCTSFMEMFPSIATGFPEGPLVIPCGQCLVMDYPSGSTLTLAEGLDIQGKLVFEDQKGGYEVTVETPFVIVQGELHMMSTSQIVNGNVKYKFIMTGAQDVSFASVDSNSQICTTTNPCNVGKKPIAVAGGKLAIQGLPTDTPTWVPLHDVVLANANDLYTREIVVTNSVWTKWGVGAELLLTSHTLNYDDTQVRTISDIAPYGQVHVKITLDSPIVRPSTVVDNPDYAVEVALLSRNIVFEASQDDGNQDHGGHLIVYGTTAPQHLQGVALHNFGQQGNLGRYPIHFHMCQNSCGSLVSKNVIRESNQRCIVIHGTHNVNVEENVAFDTKGHCFMTEDGNEKGNIFSKNLGALTQKVNTLIPNMGKNGRETDNEPSTFWASSAMNSWEGNVAAGSEGSGFWFELRLRVRGPSQDIAPPNFNPMTQNLGSFRDNVAHSNGDHGIRTYPIGYVPNEQAVFYNSRSYRNYESGIFIHNSREIAILGGVFADNRQSLDLDRAEKMHVRDVKIVGYSDEYRKIVEAEQFGDVNGKRCPPHVKLVGIDMHTYVRKDYTAPYKDYGAQISNVDMTGFVNTGCGRGSYALNFAKELETKQFDYLLTLENINLEDGVNTFDFCQVENAGVSDIFVVDRDGSLRPSTSSFTGTSTLVSRTPAMKTFIDESKCTDIADLCYSYCEDTCLRQVQYVVDSADTENYKLQVCDKANPSNCVKVGGYYYDQYKYGELDTDRNTLSLKSRYFAVSLPRGSYEAVFLDENDNPTWPAYVDTKYHQVQCSNALDDDAVELMAPALSTTECNDLIRNGDAESSTHHQYWLHRSDGIQVKQGEGIGGSNAFSDVTVTSSNLETFAQFLDSRCLAAELGSKYEVKAWVKLEDDNGVTYGCDVDAERCPEIRMTIRFPLDDGVKTKIYTIGKTTRYFDLVDGYFLLHGVVEITEEIASSTDVQFNIKRNRKDYHMFADDVSMEKINSNCDELVHNGQFSVGDSRFWDRLDGRSLDFVSPGASGSDDYALKSYGGDAQTWMRPECLEDGARYLALSKFRLIVNDFGLTCNPGATGSTKCPEMLFRTKNNGVFGLHRARAIGTPTADGWNQLYGVFTAQGSDINADEVRISFDNFNGKDLIVDDVSVRKIPVNCNEFASNGLQELVAQAQADGICV